jgi:hypothetical protein
MSATVIIRKQRVKLKAFDEQQALRMRRVINDDLQSQLELMFERVFEDNSSSELYINIERLHIDLGVLSESEVRESFTKSVEPKLISELQKQLQQYMDQHHGVHLELNSIADQEFKALLMFLETGIFPWWYSQREQKTPADILNALREEGIEKLLLNVTRFQPSGSPETMDAVIERLFIHLDPSGHEAILLRLIGLLNNGRLKVNAEAILKNRTAIGAIFSLDAKKIYQHLFGFLLQNNNRDGENFMVNFFQKIISKENISPEKLKEGELNKHLEGFDELITSSINQKEASGKVLTGRERDQFSEEDIYIGNAGLLLLHPFLQALFSSSGLLTAQSKIFVSEQSKQKASVLLYYLQSGHPNYKEWEMPLNKILCGMHYLDVMPEDIILTDLDKQNCNELLAAVVSHWSALKGAGIEALRNTFLLRAGKMSSKEGHWLAQVERTGADILLDRLPWGYSTIKLPWLDQLILTEW